MYGSVTSADIADALGRQGFDIDKRKLQLADPIKALGEYSVPIRLHRDVTAQMKVSSSRTKSPPSFSALSTSPASAGRGLVKGLDPGLRLGR